MIGSSSGSVDPDDPENDTSGDYFAITDDDEYLITSTGALFNTITWLK